MTAERPRRAIAAIMIDNFEWIMDKISGLKFNAAIRRAAPPLSRTMVGEVYI